MGSLYDTGVRPILDNYLIEEAKKKRSYGDYWSASSAGYCMRRVIFERLGVPPVTEDARKQRVFTAGHIFHNFLQKLSRDAGVSIAQELELQDEELFIRGHFDDLVLIDGHLILYDIKTANSRSFDYKKEDMSYYHKMQLGTYMYMLRKGGELYSIKLALDYKDEVENLSEGRILIIEKDTLRQKEQQLMWSDELEGEVWGYWYTLNAYWKERKMPPCTCADHENGFLAKQAYNPFYYGNEPCSLAWYELMKKEGQLHEV